MSWKEALESGLASIAYGGAPTTGNLSSRRRSLPMGHSALCTKPVWSMEYMRGTKTVVIKQLSALISQYYKPYTQ